jgi:hypothetical protein
LLCTVEAVEQIVAQIISDALSDGLDIDRLQRGADAGAAHRAGVAVKRLEAAALEQQQSRNSQQRALHPATTFTIRPGTTMMRRGGLPSSCRFTESSASAACFAVSSSDPCGIVISPRSLPLTWTAIVTVSLTSSFFSADGPARVRDERRVAEMRPAGFRQMRHHRADEQHHRLQRLAHDRAVRVGGCADGI